MSKIRIFPALLLAAAVTAACSSMPRQNALLADARSDYAAAQNDPVVAQMAASELTEAGVALDKANAAATAHRDDEEINKLAYIAKQKIATTQEIAKRKEAEKTVANASKERDRMRLESRTAEANRARVDANVAQNQAANAQAQTADAERMTAEAEARTRQLAAMLSDMAATKSERGMVITLSDVLFSVDQAQLKPAGMRTVEKLAAVMKQFPQRTVLIEGYTDSTGSSAHNIDLSNRRADAVRSAFDSMNVSRDRIAVHGYGEAYPVAENNTAENRQMNRRVEIILSEDNGRVAPR
ncbi:MAG: OmpA family protein [Rhizobium sp.]